MTAVRRFSEDNGAGSSPAPESAGGLLALRRQLQGPPDFWDRPDGDFGPLDRISPYTVEARRKANTFYRLGSKALLRDDLAPAVDWLSVAAAAGHPGALFRLAVITLRQGEDWTPDARLLLSQAAQHGHEDARRLLRAPDAASPAGEGARPQDETFFEEVHELLSAFAPGSAPSSAPAEDGVSSESRQVADESDQSPMRENATATATAMADTETDTDTGTTTGTTGAGAPEPGTGVSDLVLVSAPVLPTIPSPSPRPTDDPAAPRAQLHSVPAGLSLALPDLREEPARPHGLILPSGSPWWSANALRPATLNQLARPASPPAAVPERWQITRRARDLLQLIGPDGIDTRTLARRTGAALSFVVQMLHWLREQRFLESRDGIHYPGELMTSLTRGSLLTETLAELRDELGAAVYISSYTDGEIVIQEASSSDTAPAVNEQTPFGLSAHANAVGKSLLAQQNFASRMDHLSRYPFIQLTDRTITDERTLFQHLDTDGPHAAQFDLLEYADTDLCVAYSLGLPNRASSLALSMPATQHSRLITAARTLSRRATGILLAHLLADDVHQPTVHHTGRWENGTAEARHALP
ncbi:IclR family transcriptional regulator C-terminal domain-containing protein [Streptomyces sp. NPDC048659]|uniref:IclR family transcriptional regulator domain-containing protein n=1 Tax=Streptomyces sp. NPDC048659 TaxID=3155489 RepID=UPI00341DF0EA